MTTYVAQANTGADQQVTTRSVTKPAGVSAGHVGIFWVVRWEPSGSFPAVTPPAGAVLRGTLLNGTEQSLCYLLKVASQSSFTFSWTGTRWAALSALFFSGVDPALDLSTAPFQSLTGSGTAVSTLSVTTVDTAALAWHVNTIATSGSSHSPPTSFTEVVDVSPYANAYRIASGSGSQSASGATDSPSGTWAAALVALAPASTGSAVTADASLAATAGLSATARRGTTADASLAATAGLSATGLRATTAGATLAATAALSATARRDTTAAASLAATAGLDATALRATTADGTLPATAGLTASGSVGRQAGATLAATATLTASATVQQAAITADATLAATADLTATVQHVANAQAGLDAAAGLTAGVRLAGTVQATLAATATLTAAASVFTPGTDIDLVIGPPHNSGWLIGPPAGSAWKVGPPS